ncbi:hypothetical protein D3C80_1509300 [compost metagenome]
MASNVIGYNLRRNFISCLKERPLNLAGYSLAILSEITRKTDGKPNIAERVQIICLAIPDPVRYRPCSIFGGTESIV